MSQSRSFSLKLLLTSILVTEIRKWDTAVQLAKKSVECGYHFTELPQETLLTCDGPHFFEIPYYFSLWVESKNPSCINCCGHGPPWPQHSELSLTVSRAWSCPGDSGKHIGKCQWGGLAHKRIVSRWGLGRPWPSVEHLASDRALWTVNAEKFRS